jgi:hypothetical protein
MHSGGFHGIQDGLARAWKGSAKGCARLQGYWLGLSSFLKRESVPVSFLSLCVYFLVSFTGFMVAAEKESCLSCWLSVVGLVARKIVIAFLKRIYILISIRGKTPTN